MKTNHTCKTCVHFEPHPDTVTEGLCHRYPPASENSEFPMVLTNEWCGEYSLNPDLAEKELSP